MKPKPRQLKKGKKSIYFYVPIYRKRVCAYIDFTYDEFCKLFKKEWGKEPPEYPEVAGLNFQHNSDEERFKGHHFLWISKSEDMGNYLHELFHLTVSIMSSVQMNLTRDSEEAFAYLQGYLFEKLSGTRKD